MDFNGDLLCVFIICFVMLATLGFANFHKGRWDINRITTTTTTSVNYK